MKMEMAESLYKASKEFELWLEPWLPILLMCFEASARGKL